MVRSIAYNDGVKVGRDILKFEIKPAETRMKTAYLKALALKRNEGIRDSFQRLLNENPPERRKELLESIDHRKGIISGLKNG